MRPKLIGELGEEPISIEEARQHLEQPRYDDSDVDPMDDAQIEGFVIAAREHCENFLGLSLSTRTLEIALDQYPRDRDCHWRTLTPPGIDLPMGPVREVLFVGSGGDPDSSDFVTMDPADYVLDDFSAQGSLKPVSAWPVATRATNTIRVRYLAGYGADSDGGEALPKVIRAAILLVMGELYANRENAGETQLYDISSSARNLLRPLRVRLGMA